MYFHCLQAVSFQSRDPFFFSLTFLYVPSIFPVSTLSLLLYFTPAAIFLAVFSLLSSWPLPKLRLSSFQSFPFFNLLFLSPHRASFALLVRYRAPLCRKFYFKPKPNHLITVPLRPLKGHSATCKLTGLTMLKYHPRNSWFCRSRAVCRSCALPWSTRPRFHVQRI